MGPLKKIGRQTVWYTPNLVTIPERFHLLYTAYLPATYGAFIVLGAVGLESQVPAIRTAFGPEYAAMWVPGLIAAAVLCFLTLAFYPRLKKLLRVELAAVVWLLALLVFYIGALLYLGYGQGDVARQYLGFGCLAFLGMPIFRMVDIVKELRREVTADAAAAKEQEDHS